MDDLVITRRHLPHWTLGGAWYYVTFCLMAGVLAERERSVVLKHIKSGHDRFYRLIAISVMPDHVHVILRPNDEITISRVLKGIKGTTACEINRMRRSIGPLWQSESWDRILRDDDELQEKLNYMLQNPVKEGLTDNPWTYQGWFLQS